MAHKEELERGVAEKNARLQKQLAEKEITGPIEDLRETGG